MQTVLVILCVIALYMMVYYRLMVSYHYQKQFNINEGTLGALLSFPPYKRLNEKGRRYSKRYWLALGILIAGVVCLAQLRGSFSRFL